MVPRNFVALSVSHPGGTVMVALALFILPPRAVMVALTVKFLYWKTSVGVRMGVLTLTFAAQSEVSSVMLKLLDRCVWVGG